MLGLNCLKYFASACIERDNLRLVHSKKIDSEEGQKGERI